MFWVGFEPSGKVELRSVTGTLESVLAAPVLQQASHMSAYARKTKQLTVAMHEKAGDRA